MHYSVAHLTDIAVVQVTYEDEATVLDEATSCQKKNHLLLPGQVVYCNIVPILVFSLTQVNPISMVYDASLGGASHILTVFSLSSLPRAVLLYLF